MTSLLDLVSSLDYIEFDTKFESSLDGLAFSRSPLLSVYADMSICCEEYASDETMLELVFAPVTPETGASRNWLAASDEEVVDATLDELRQLFPDDLKTAKLRKSTYQRSNKLRSGKS